MKQRFLIAVVSLLSILLTSIPTVSADYQIRYAAEDFVIQRTGAGSEVVAHVKRNDLLLVRGCASIVCEVMHPRSTRDGFSYGAIRTNVATSTHPRTPTEGFGKTNRLLNIRSLPIEASVKLGEILPDRRVKRDRCVGQYCYIFTEAGVQGWIARSGIDMDRVIKVERLPRVEGVDSIFKGDAPKIELFR